MTFCSTVNSVIISGAKPVLADVNLSTMNICPEEIKKNNKENKSSNSGPFYWQSL